MSVTAWEAWRASDDFREMAVEWLLTEADADDLPPGVGDSLILQAILYRRDDLVAAALEVLHHEDIDGPLAGTACDLFEDTRSADLCFDHWLDGQTDRGES